jgi:RNA polymerase nonessential primary-like sigma factor
LLSGATETITMPAQPIPTKPFYAETEYDEPPNTLEFQAAGAELDTSDLEAEQAASDLVNSEIDSDDGASLSRGASRRTTDLVRMYLQEIGRVRLLGRDEEVSEAQRVQRHMRLLELCHSAAKTDETMHRYAELIDIHDRMASNLGHRPSWERWASEAGVSVDELKQVLFVGKRRWAELADVSLEELDCIQREGAAAKDHMIKAKSIKIAGWSYST